ncbi:MAG: hypothetical protein EKK40_03470 [Bradyrhizobiaceae bacterium]|nr:MAG: hypothetical protein EKK40_03470 [Bradyrhizobiaceae bacterium]
MSLSRIAFENDACPVTEDMLGSLYRASEHGLPVLVESVSSDVRAMLALFCYRRAHLHSMSLAIAATCNERDLVEQGGIVGKTLFAMSREAPTDAPSPSSYGNRRSITLSTKPLTTFAALDEDLDEELDDDLKSEPAPLTA